MTRKAGLITAIVALQALDGLSTKLAIAHGVAESNGIVSALGLWPAKLLVVFLALTIGWRMSSKALTAVVAFYSIVVLWNLHFSIDVIPVLAVSIVGAGAVAWFLFLTKVDA